MSAKDRASLSTDGGRSCGLVIAAAYEAFRITLYAVDVFRILALLFIVVPIAEIWVLIQVGSVIGGLETVIIMILVSVIGAWMVRREGLGAIERVIKSISGGENPTKELVDGLLIGLAGALMLTPGFITDVTGLALLFPPSRIIVRTVLIRRFRGRFETITTTGMTGAGFGYEAPGSDIIDVGEADYRRDEEPDNPPQLDS